ncbi:hypothetical protein Ocin01_04943 [Orchesella cincta]|uniref:Ig-like domain-containing protein n=1 Tax=Orchesella cincta TaxID=48709 RepID=A0A1D2N8Z6_ORCCI|nr:hypothetical protein Ocin01_04943 [Orchesella cincta]
MSRTGSDGVKDVQLQGPRYARISEDLMLRCNYDLETDSLYAVKWYRGSEEFYRFLPKESPPKQTFPITGILVDVSLSTLNSISKCTHEASSEEKQFQQINNDNIHGFSCISKL